MCSSQKRHYHLWCIHFPSSTWCASVATFCRRKKSKVWKGATDIKQKEEKFVLKGNNKTKRYLFIVLLWCYKSFICQTFITCSLFTALFSLFLFIRSFFIIFQHLFYFYSHFFKQKWKWLLLFFCVELKSKIFDVRWCFRWIKVFTFCWQGLDNLEKFCICYLGFISYAVSKCFDI